MSAPLRSPNTLTAFRHAFSGLWQVIRSQRNARIHALATLLVVLLSLWLGLGSVQWALVITAIAIVWISECFNTALELAIDLSQPELHPLARLGKDAAAAGVLLSALASLGIGLLVLGPPLWNRLLGG